MNFRLSREFPQSETASALCESCGRRNLFVEVSGKTGRNSETGFGPESERSDVAESLADMVLDRRVSER
jgi:hypothetical protein